MPGTGSAAPAAARGIQYHEAMHVEPSPPLTLTFVQNPMQSPVPHTVIASRPRESVVTYTVASSDTLLATAERWDLRPDVRIWANEELEATPAPFGSPALRAYALATSPEHGSPDVASGNGSEGMGNFVWPTSGYISQGYSDLHRAVDIAGTHGDVVVAADAGLVTYAAWDHVGYGYLIVIDHGNGFISYYAHLYGFYVEPDQLVQRGQPIGARGDTGHSTGSHLHFEIRYNGEPRDPLAFLPGP